MRLLAFLRYVDIYSHWCPSQLRHGCWQCYFPRRRIKILAIMIHSSSRCERPLRLASRLRRMPAYTGVLACSCSSQPPRRALPSLVPGAPGGPGYLLFQPWKESWNQTFLQVNLAPFIIGPFSPCKCFLPSSTYCSRREPWRRRLVLTWIIFHSVSPAASFCNHAGP